MKPEEKKIVSDSLVKLFKITPEDLASLFNEAGDLINFTAVERLDSERTTRFTDDRNNQFSRGVKEGAQKIEKAIKEKYSIESDKTGIDLVDHVVVEKVSEAKTSEEVSDKHPYVMKARRDWEKEQKERDKEWQKKLDNMQVEFDRAKTFEFVKTKADGILTGLKPIFSSNPLIANNIKNLFFDELAKQNFKRQDEEVLIFDKEGNPMKDAHGYTKSFNDVVKEVADKYFEYQTSEGRSNSGNQNAGGQGGQSGQAGQNGKMPRTEEERMTMLRDEKITRQQRKAITEYVIK